MALKKQRYSPQQVYYIEGEVEIGRERVWIERKVARPQRYLAAYSRRQATKLFAQRFSRMFRLRVYVGEAYIYPVKELPVTPVSAGRGETSWPAAAGAEQLQLKF